MEESCFNFCSLQIRILNSEFEGLVNRGSIVDSLVKQQFDLDPFDRRSSKGILGDGLELKIDMILAPLAVKEE